MLIKTLNDLGGAIRNARKTKGLTQAELAGQLGAAQDWISNIEGGRIENPSLSKILQICKALDVDIHVNSSAAGSPRAVTDVPAFVRSRR